MNRLAEESIVIRAVDVVFVDVRQAIVDGAGREGTGASAKNLITFVEHLLHRHPNTRAVVVDDGLVGKIRVAFIKARYAEVESNAQREDLGGGHDVTRGERQRLEVQLQQGRQRTRIAATFVGRTPRIRALHPPGHQLLGHGRSRPQQRIARSRRLSSRNYADVCKSDFQHPGGHAGGER